MGGVADQVRGSSKIETYIKYKELVEDSIMESKNPDPLYKKECKRRMIWDSETEEWVLYYHLHT